MKGNLLQQLGHYYQTNFGYLWELFVNHLLMSVYGVIFASIVGIPLEYLLRVSVIINANNDTC